MDDMSDELKLQLIKSEFDKLMLCIKMQVTVQTTLEAYRQYVSKELPEQFIPLVETDEFKETFNRAVKASNEILGNMVTFADNVGVVFGTNLTLQLPKDQDGFRKMNQELHDELEKQVSEREFGWLLNSDSEEEE